MSVSTYQPGWLCPQWHFLWLQPEKHLMYLCKSLHYVKAWKHFGGGCFNSHQNSCIRHSSRSGHCSSLRDLSLSLASSGNLRLAGCSLDLGSSSLLLLGQLLSLLLLCKGLQTHTQCTKSNTNANMSVKMISDDKLDLKVLLIHDTDTDSEEDQSKVRM